ncbi:MAG: hypothetical protein GY846_14230 [Deltaproteobacteria bacterium]|nr:hypothetical protein [Deltaproteobacteria bacterium]
MEPHHNMRSSKIKTTVLFEKSLLEEIDEFNPFKTRKDFLDQACKIYLKELRRIAIDEKLAKACSEAESEDNAVNEEWESITLEGLSCIPRCSGGVRGRAPTMRDARPVDFKGC